MGSRGEKTGRWLAGMSRGEEMARRLARRRWLAAGLALAMVLAVVGYLVWALWR